METSTGCARVVLYTCNDSQYTDEYIYIYACIDTHMCACVHYQVPFQMPFGPSETVPRHPLAVDGPAQGCRLDHGMRLALCAHNPKISVRTWRNTTKIHVSHTRVHKTHLAPSLLPASISRDQPQTGTRCRFHRNSDAIFWSSW